MSYEETCDEFAKAALQGLLFDSFYMLPTGNESGDGITPSSRLAARAYEIAEAMMVRRAEVHAKARANRVRPEPTPIPRGGR